MHIHTHPLTSRKMVTWMSVLFMFGASCFAIASIMFLLPKQDADFWNKIYFVGSIPFTSAAFLQLLDATNQEGQSWKLMAYRPQNRGYMAGLTQWLGTILFNFNTYDATLQLSWLQDDFAVWTPNMVGSILFLISGYILLKEIGFTYSISNKSNLSVWINMLGCVTFMISAVASIYLPIELGAWVTNLALVNTLAGALCFFTCAVLSYQEVHKKG
ncbi:hypothetical protein [Flammeovirga sp. SubArs3]|uniref:hypothetical protein n=1 Tax=Flammeovirga sp. SubArs3 TaxID=2995316 RepID=UPI00248A9E8A|nr:hypothetical protein [Flammeovirga sp. SubArs3]